MWLAVPSAFDEHFNPGDAEKSVEKRRRCRADGCDSSYIGEEGMCKGYSKLCKYV